MNGAVCVPHMGIFERGVSLFHANSLSSANSFIPCRLYPQHVYALDPLENSKGNCHVSTKIIASEMIKGYVVREWAWHADRAREFHRMFKEHYFGPLRGLSDG